MRERIGKFDILMPLGAGAMGEVYLARDPMIGREIALKVIRQDSSLFMGKGEVARERFFREARAAGNLNHPNLVTVHEFGEDEGLLYIAMELVEGEDLVVLMEARRLTPAETLELLAQVCDGLAHAHAKGVLHRDIKPSNIRVTKQDGRLVAKLMDFGIARVSGSDLTGTGTLMGTFGYMAPEYVQGGKASASADLFAVGVILYEALSGRRAFEGDTGATVLYKIVHAQPAPLEAAHIKGLSPGTQAVLDRALAKDPRWRFPDGSAFAAALRSAKDPAWNGPRDWQADATREAPKPDLSHPSSSGEAILLPGLTPGPAPVTTRAPKRIPTVYIRPPEPEEAWRKWLWPATGLLLILGAGGLWALKRWRLPVLSAAPAIPPVAASQGRPTAKPPGPGAGLPARPDTGTALPAQEAAPASSDPQARPSDPPAPSEPPPRNGGGRRDPEGFDSALSEVEEKPEQALEFFERAVREEPDHVPSHALRLYCLYRLNRARELGSALQEAIGAGATPQHMAHIPHFRRMVDDERRSPRLPKEVSTPLMAGLEPPGRPQGRPPGN